MDALLALLSVPSDLIREETPTEILDTWKRETARPALSRLHQLLAERPSDSPLPLTNRAAIAYTTTVFDGDEGWTDSIIREMALAVLNDISPIDVSLVRAVLIYYVKPLFAPTPHPLLNDTTGRKRSRGSAGGALAAQDHYEGQKWKTYVGTANVLSWCIRICKTEDFEDLWHLLVPPVMTLLDDYETKYKLQGIRLASSLTIKVTPALLKKTGLDALIFSSYKTALTHLHDPLSAQLIRAAIQSASELVIHTTISGSEARFERFCALLGDGVIGTIWTYGAHDAAVVDASIHSLPMVLREMGIMSARYLKVLIPQLLHPLMTSTAMDGSALSVETLHHQLSALRALGVVLDVCSMRMYRWKGTIIDGVGRCWIIIADAEASMNDTAKFDDGRELREEVKMELKAISIQLAGICPTVIEDEYARLSQLSPTFSSLFGGISTISKKSSPPPPSA